MLTIRRIKQYNGVVFTVLLTYMTVRVIEKLKMETDFVHELTRGLTTKFYKCKQGLEILFKN